MSSSSAPTTESASENGHGVHGGGHGASSSPSPLTGSSFWYLDNPSSRKRKIYSGPYEGKKIVLAMVGLPGRFPFLLPPLPFSLFLPICFHLPEIDSPSIFLRSSLSFPFCSFSTSSISLFSCSSLLTSSPSHQPVPKPILR
jgi:hypothetical protein